MFATTPDDVRGVNNDSPANAHAGLLPSEIAKNALDSCLALVLLVVTAPVVLVSMFLVRLTPRVPPCTPSSGSAATDGSSRSTRSVPCTRTASGNRDRSGVFPATAASRQ